MKKLFLALLLFPSILLAQEPINFWAAYDIKHRDFSVVVAQKRTTLESLPFVGDLGLYTLVGWNFDSSRISGGGAIVKEYTPPKSNVTFYVGLWAGFEVDEKSKLTGGAIGGISIIVK